MAVYVVITGSRGITRSAHVPLVVGSLIKRQAQIIVGDAPGVDRLIVAEAIRRGYGKHVTVVGAYKRCRNRYAFGRVGRIIMLPSTYLARNLYMVGLADECIAIWDGRSRGTKFTAGCAEKAGLPVRIVQERG